MAKKRAETGAKRPKRSPLDDMRREWRVVSYLSLRAWFAESPRDIGGTVTELLREFGVIYGDVACTVRCSRRALPRNVMEEMYDHLASARYGPDFRLTTRVLAEGPLLSHLKQNPEYKLCVCAPHSFAETRQRFELEWLPPKMDTPFAQRPWAELRVEMSLGWALKSELERFRSLVDRVIKQLSELGAIYATLSPTFLQSPVQYDALPPCEYTGSFGRRSIFDGWDYTGPAIMDGFVPGAAWRTLFGAKHLARLGGRDSFTRELVDDWERWLGNPVQVRPLGDHFLDVMFMHRPPDPSAQMWFGIIGRFHHDTDDGLVRLNARLAKAGLLFCQMPGYLEILTPLHMRKHALQVTEQPAPKRDRVFADTAAFMAYVWSHPPRSIRAVAAAVSARERKWVERHAGKHVTAFVVGPESGDMLHSIWTKSTKGTTLFMKPPILVGGPTKSSAHFVFDPDHDGFDGYFNDKPPRPLQGLVPFHCAKCGHDVFRSLAMFWYDDSDEWLEDQEDADVIENLFHWFTLQVTCGRCKHSIEGASIECA